MARPPSCGHVDVLADRGNASWGNSQTFESRDLSQRKLEVFFPKEGINEKAVL